MALVLTLYLRWVYSDQIGGSGFRYPDDVFGGIMNLIMNLTARGSGNLPLELSPVSGFADRLVVPHCRACA